MRIAQVFEIAFAQQTRAVVAAEARGMHTHVEDGLVLQQVDFGVAHIAPFSSWRRRRRCLRRDHRRRRRRGGCRGRVDRSLGNKVRTRCEPRRLPIYSVHVAGISLVDVEFLAHMLQVGQRVVFVLVAEQQRVEETAVVATVVVAGAIVVVVVATVDFVDGVFDARMQMLFVGGDGGRV